MSKFLARLILVSNVPESPPAEIVARYMALADIERGFRVLKSEIEIAPVFHRLPDRTRAHALICFSALRLYRALRFRLRAKARPFSPKRAVEIARTIQYPQVAPLCVRPFVGSIGTQRPAQHG